MTNYIVKLDSNNIILSYEAGAEDLGTLIEQSQKKNEDNTEKEIHYAPFFHAKQEPTIGKNINEEQRLKGVKPSDEATDKCKDDVDAALRILMATDMTITATNQCPLPGMEAKDAHMAIEMVMMLLVALKVMNDNYKEERAEQKQSVKDLFKDLGLK